MNALFDDFKNSLDHHLELAKEPPAEMYFLRYDSPLLFPRNDGQNPFTELAWQEYIRLLDDCQNYAVSREVTSTYIFFDRSKFEEWQRVMNEPDNIETRAKWAATTQIKEDVVTHVGNPITYFLIVGHPDWYRITPEKL